MGRLPPARLAWWKVAPALALALAAAVTACGSGGTAPSPSPGASSPAVSASPASALCQDAAALRDSLDKLTHVSVGSGTVNEVKADLADVKAKLTTFAADAQGQWQTQTAALQTALGKLQTAVTTLASHPTAGGVSNVLAALGDVNTAAQRLLAVVNTRCPSVSPSASA